MHPEQIKAALRMRGFTCAAVADALKVQGGTVSRVISRETSSARIETYIAGLINQPVEKLFPPRKPNPLVRRRKPVARAVAEGAAQ